jgi:hypothetical protein
MLRKILPVCLMFALAGCHQPSPPEQKDKEQVTPASTWTPPPAGTVVDQIKERITEDNLNEKYFSVVVVATENSKTGSYLLKLEQGFNKNETIIDLPKWTGGATLKPVLQKGTEKYSCIIGFDTGDGQFHEFYQVKAEGGNLKLKQTTGYYEVKP